MTEPAQVAKSVTHVPGRKCNPCIGTFRNRIETGSKTNRNRTKSRIISVNHCEPALVQSRKLQIRRTNRIDLTPP